MIYTLKHMPLWGNTEDATKKNCETFQWPSADQLTKFPDGDFHLKELKLKSAFDQLNTGICSVRVILTNGESSGDIDVVGGVSNMTGCLKMPEDP